MSAQPVRDPLEDRLGPPADAWRPEAGERLIGTVVDVGMRDGSYGPYPIVTVEVEPGLAWAIHAYHHVLRTELERLNPRIGERIGIAYYGRHPEKDYERYVVRMDREEDGQLDLAEASAPTPAAEPAPAADAEAPASYDPADEDIPF